MDLIEQLFRDEGFRASPYLDSRGISTVGVGHNLIANPLPEETYPMTLDRAKEILNQDLARITNKLVADLPWVASLPDVYAGVLKNMAFNMGAKGEEAFHHMLADVQAGDYVHAAAEMQNSAWYTQVGARAQRLVKQMLTGEWQ